MLLLSGNRSRFQDLHQVVAFMTPISEILAPSGTDWFATQVDLHQGPPPARSTADRRCCVFLADDYALLNKTGNR